MTIRRTGCRFAEEDMVDGSSFVMTSRSILVDSSAFNKTRHPPKLRRVFCCESPSIFHRVQVELKKKRKQKIVINVLLDYSPYLDGFFRWDSKKNVTISVICLFDSFIH